MNCSYHYQADCCLTALPSLSQKRASVAYVVSDLDIFNKFSTVFQSQERLVHSRQEQVVPEATL